MTLIEQQADAADNRKAGALSKDDLLNLPLGAAVQCSVSRNGLGRAAIFTVQKRTDGRVTLQSALSGANIYPARLWDVTRKIGSSIERVH